MRNRGLTILLAVLAFALAVAAAGCGSSSDETSGTTPAAERQGSEASPPASTPTTPANEQEAPVGVRAERCGEGATSGGEIRVTGVSCELGRSLVAGWYKNRACAAPKGASRTSCRLGEFTCLGAVTDRGVAVTCAGPGRSVAFIGREPS
jgi:hypothetical protein